MDHSAHAGLVNPRYEWLAFEDPAFEDKVERKISASVPSM
jgi:hypothetical protein